MKTTHRFVGSLVLGWLILSCAGGDRIVGPPSTASTNADSTGRVGAPTDGLSATTVTASYTDAFTGTAGALSGTWTQQRTSGTINRTGGGLARGSVGAQDLFAFWSGNSFSNDQYSQARITGGLSSGSQYVQIIVRASGTGDGIYRNYLFYTDGVAGANHTEVAKNINGTQITIRSFATTFATGDIIKISAVGTTITCYKNGVALGSITDSSLPSGSAGVGVYGSTLTVDDWEGGSLSTVQAPVATVTVSPASANVMIGGTQQLSATTKDASGNTLTGRAVTWSSDAPSVATVSTSGLVSAVAEGSATITATSEGQSGTSALTVTRVPVATVTVTPPSATVVVGNTQQLVATAKDASGASLTGRAVAWASDNSAATVDANGLVTAVSAGTANITATSEGKNGTSVITVTLVPVSSVTVSPASASIVAGATQQFTATLKDANNNELTGRSVSWSSGNPAVAKVDATTGLVTGLSSGGPVTITATSEGKSGTASVTVTPVPVATVTVTPSPTMVPVGGVRSLTATIRDANNNVLTGRTVSWTSDAPSVATVNGSGVVSGVTTGSATVTATSEGQSGTSSVTVTPAASGTGPLRVSTRNRRYFETAAGQIVYLTGSHTWGNLQDNGNTDPPAQFNYTSYLEFLTARGHNFVRLWVWEQTKWTAEISSEYWISPGPYLRAGTTSALDGKPKFDLNQFNQAFFDRVRSRVQEAGARGMYVALMLFDGWSVTTKPGYAANNPWKGHPFNSANNLNGIDGDANRDGLGTEAHTLVNPAVTALQDAYVRKMISTVSDLDNVLFEISNESDASSKAWQYHMIQVIRDHEATLGKQHPVGITAMWPGGTDSDLYNSGADWISPMGSLENPPAATGSKVIISDTDHLCGVCGNVAWVWRSFTRGQNPILMDGYDGAAIGLGAREYNASNPVWEAIRKNLGYARGFASRMNLAAAVPRGDLASTGYCLASVGSEYLVFFPNGGTATVNLAGVSGTRTVEWLNTANGQSIVSSTVNGGGSVNLRSPFGGAASVAYIRP